MSASIELGAHDEIKAEAHRVEQMAGVDLQYLFGIAGQVGNIVRGQDFSVIQPILYDNIGKLVGDRDSNTQLDDIKGVNPAHGARLGKHYNPDPLVGAAAAQYITNRVADSGNVRTENITASCLEKFALSLARCGVYKTKLGALNVITDSLRQNVYFGRLKVSEIDYSLTVVDELMEAESKEALKLATWAGLGLSTLAGVSVLWQKTRPN